MSQVIRLSSGGSIQVRTGVIQGVGPQGPRGLVGSQGATGDQGPQGDVGPIGQILALSTRVAVSGSQALNTGINTLMSFSQTSYDDLSAVNSATNFVFSTPGDYLVAGYLQYNLGSNAGDGYRMLSLVSSIQGTLGVAQVPAVPADVTVLNLSIPVRLIANERLQLFAKSTDDVSITVNVGTMTFTRVGSGPAGPAGPQGPAGSIGATGPDGPQGPAGNANSGYTTYQALEGP